MLRLCMPCTFICINSAHRKCGIVGLLQNFSYEIGHNLVEFFRAKTNMIVIYSHLCVYSKVVPLEFIFIKDRFQ